MERTLQGKFHKALYENLRGIPNVTDKIAIANVFLTAHKDSKTFAALLYAGHGLEYWINERNEYFKQALSADDNVIANILINANEKNCFLNMVESCRQIFDADRYYKALYDGDEFATGIYEACAAFDSLAQIRWG